jgi:beta-galactosidase/beta-glucuronidase
MAGDVNWSRAWSASVPGSVHETLLEHGVIHDPGIGTNVLACRWVEETVWYYRRTFKLPSLRKGERAWLFFETLDLAAKIYLNGVQIGSHANAFHPCRVEATTALRNGENELAVTARRNQTGCAKPKASSDGIGRRASSMSASRAACDWKSARASAGRRRY